MRPTSKWAMVTLVATVVAVISPASVIHDPVQAQSQQVCRVYIGFQNMERYVHGSVDTECPGSIHTSPWGNWGVDSNVGSRTDGNQFRGWYPFQSAPTKEWNSCTSSFPPPDPAYYNADGWTTQRSGSSEGTYTYGSVMVWEPASAPCSTVFLDGGTYDTQGNYMDIYELDPGCCDSRVALAQLPNMSVVLGCPFPSDTCTTYGPWLNPTSVSPNVLTADVRMFVHAQTETSCMDC